MEPARTVAGRPAATGTAAGFAVTDLSLLSVVLIWGVNFAVIKSALQQLSPLTFSGVRFTAASLLLLAIFRLRRGDFSLTRRDALALIVIGLIGNTGYQILFIEGIARTTAANSALILAAVPVIVAAESHFLGIERLRPLAWRGVFLSVFGLYLVTLGGSHGIRFGSESFAGDLLTLAAAVCWATYTVLTKPLLSRHAPLKVTALSMSAGAIPLLLIATPSLIAQPWGSVTALGYAGLTYSGLFAICTAYVIWANGVQKVGSARTAVYSNLVPVIAVLTAFAFLSEAISWLQLAGAGVIFAGIALTRIKR